MAAHLFVQRVEKLLTRRSASECSAVMKRSAEATEIQQTFRSAREGNAHSVEEIDNRGSHLAHCFYGRLVRQKISAVDCVVEMLPGRIALAFGVHSAIDSALRADRMRALHGHNGEEVNRVTLFGNLHRCRQSCESAAYDCYSDSVRGCHLCSFSYLTFVTG